MAGGNIYIAQHSFATGEVSPDIANRTDLDKYRAAVTRALNCVIHPYGSIGKRNGTRFLGEAKYTNRKTRLVEFKGNGSCFLEVGHTYIRIWQNDQVAYDITTPYGEEVIDSLHFNQSADTVFICSPIHPVHILQNMGTWWKFGQYAFTVPPFEDMNTNINHKLWVNAEGSRIYSSAGFFTPSMVGMVFKLKHRMPAVIHQGTGQVGYIPRAFGGDIVVPGYVSMGLGNYGDDTDIEWKIVTHGEWAGKVSVLIKNLTDSNDFENYRTYTGNRDYNVTETGTFPRNSQLQVNAEITSGSVNIDFTVKPYIQSGMVVITRFISAVECEIAVIKSVGKTSATSEWQISSWGPIYGYPRMSTFFQDRLIFAGSSAFPYKVWMSRTGDYPNFDVEKVDGTLTDDSSITVSLISRSAFTITHLISAQDLIILTDGNEWIIDGGDAIKPSKVLPRSQTQHGAADCEPQYIGNRLIYVQRRSSTVRDLGYTYESDNYNGIDLTLLAKHLVKDRSLIDSAYCQEPDSILYFVRNDGVLLSLTIIRDQDVYAWAQLETAGQFLSICSTPNGNEDSLYAVVQRNILGENKRYIERLDSPANTANISDYVTVDSMRKFINPGKSINVPHLAGLLVQLIADGNRIPDMIVGNDGVLQLPAEYNTVYIGAGFEMKITLPEIALDMKDGSLKGRTIKTNSVTLRLRNSRGGYVGVSYGKNMNKINSNSLIEDLYTGDVNVVVPAQGKGFGNDNELCIYHDDPYPFNLLTAIRDVTIGGGLIARYNNNPL